MNFNELSNLIESVANALHINIAYIEKGFYVVSLLKAITSKADNIIFKGGTCLSKCFKLINRFSEDIDLSIIEEHLSESKRRNLIHTIIEGSIKEINLLETNPKTIRSRRTFNRFICGYESFYTTSGIEPSVIVELAMMSPCFPYEHKKIQTFVGEYLDSIGRNDLTKQYGLEAFEVKVQKLERTFVDKIFALCDYQISKKLTRQSRHIYDLYKIFPVIDFNDDLLKLFSDVKKNRIDNPTCYSAKEGQKLSTIFKDLIEQKTFKNDFDNITAPLLYDNVKYEECVSTLNNIQQYLLNNNL